MNTCGTFLYNEHMRNLLVQCNEMQRTIFNKVVEVEKAFDNTPYSRDYLVYGDDLAISHRDQVHGKTSSLERNASSIGLTINAKTEVRTNNTLTLQPSRAEVFTLLLRMAYTCLMSWYHLTT